MRPQALACCLPAPPPPSGKTNSDRLIKIISPDIAGTTHDTLARIVADKLQSKWGKPVIVENRPGASTNIAAEAVAKAEPDGYTLIVAPPVTFSVSQHLFSNLRHDPAAFVPITVIATTPNVLVVRPGLPASSVQELIALATTARLFNRPLGWLAIQLQLAMIFIEIINLNNRSTHPI